MTWSHFARSLISSRAMSSTIHVVPATTYCGCYAARSPSHAPEVREEPRPSVQGLAGTSFHPRSQVSMRRIALVTFAASPELSASDACLAAARRARGHEVMAVPWDSATTWSSFDAAVIRSTWDYHRRPTDFAAWLDAVEQESARVRNSPRVIRWNMHKRYLLDLAEAGVNIVPTEVIGQRQIESIASIARRRGWSDVVVKPAIGASATGVTVHRADALGSADERLRAITETGDCLVQPLIEQIVEGEWSLVFFGGEFSHAALKKPAAGDIRVQRQHGGRTVIATPPPSIIRQARAALVAASMITHTNQNEFTYARVDGVVVGNRFTLMELELIEPACS